MKQKTIGINPLEEYLGSSRDSKGTNNQKEPIAQQTNPLSGKQRITLHISAAVIDRA